MDDLAERLDLIIAVVEGARAMPLSTSCVLNRAELLEALEDLRARLPGRLAEADRVLADSEAIIDDAHRRAAAIVADGRREGVRLASGSAVVRQAEADAAAIVATARQASDDMRGQIDSYVDGKLAGFEELLGRTLSSVTRGRERLASRGAVAMARAGQGGDIGAGQGTGHATGHGGGHQAGAAVVTVGSAGVGAQGAAEYDEAHDGPESVGVGEGEAGRDGGGPDPYPYPGVGAGQTVGPGDAHAADGLPLQPAGGRYGQGAGGHHWSGLSRAHGELAGHVRLTSGAGAGSPIG